MTDHIEKAPKNLRMGVDEFTRLADQIKVLPDLETYLQKNLFGSDPLGIIIGSVIVERRVKPLASELNIRVELLYDHASNLHAMANRDIATEQTIASDINKRDI
jgi:hypothetical protein